MEGKGLLAVCVHSVLTGQYVLEQGLTDFLFKGPDSKYFNLCKLYGLCPYSTLVQKQP